MTSLAPEEGSAASPCAKFSKNADEGNRSTVASPVRHMHRDVAELLLACGTTPRRRRRKRPVSAPAAAEARGRARYDCAFEDEAPADAEDGGFAPPQLVWVKVLGYPWWPGQVFAPADASAHARKNRRRDAVLVACFGDRTFVWADAEDLLPFRDGFPRLADTGGRSSSRSAFAPALDDALDEVSRRVDAGLSCGCCGAANIKKQVVQNSGVKRGARGAPVDAAFARDAFRGEAFLRYVRALAMAPEDGADRLDLAIAGPQMNAFRRWRNAANTEHDSTAGVDDVADGAMVVSARARRGRATTPRRERGRRGLSPGDAPAGEPTLSMCARAAAVAAADVAFMRHIFPGEAVEEYASAMAVTPPPTGAYRRDDLGVATTPQRKAFDEWRSAANGNAAVEAATPPPGRRASPAAGTPCRTVTSCISSGGDSPCENDGVGAWETDSEDFEPASEWELGWKDYVIVIQFLAIVMLVCRLME